MGKCDTIYSTFCEQQSIWTCQFNHSRRTHGTFHTLKCDSSSCTNPNCIFEKKTDESTAFYFAARAYVNGSPSMFVQYTWHQFVLHTRCQKNSRKDQTSLSRLLSRKLVTTFDATASRSKVSERWQGTQWGIILMQRRRTATKIGKTQRSCIASGSR